MQVSSIVQPSVLSDPDLSLLYLDFRDDLDLAALNYYPLKNDFTVESITRVATDIDVMVNSITGKPIVLQECGYPSSSVNNSSEIAQADFVTAVFESWDRHSDRISLIDFTWQFDVSEETVDQWVIDYGMSGQPNENIFKAYLWSIGFNNYDSTEKLALQRLRDELAKRSWVSE